MLAVRAFFLTNAIVLGLDSIFYVQLFLYVVLVCAFSSCFFFLEAFHCLVIIFFGVSFNILINVFSKSTCSVSTLSDAFLTFLFFTSFSSNVNIPLPTQCGQVSKSRGKCEVVITTKHSTKFGVRFLFYLFYLCLLRFDLFP